MPKLPMLETKASAAAPAIHGRISGRMMVPKVRVTLAPEARAASIMSPGRPTSPARSVMNTMGACWTPKSKMMPVRPMIGLGVPGGGAMPSMFSKVLDGPVRCSHDRAVTCGAMISGINRRKPSTLRVGRSVSATATAKGTPMASDSNAPKNAVSRVFHVARSTDGLARRSRKADRSSSPPGASAATTRRAAGSRPRTKISAITIRTAKRGPAVPAGRIPRSQPPGAVADRSDMEP